MSFLSALGNPRSRGTAASCLALLAANPAASPVGNDIALIVRPSAGVTL